MKTYLKTLLFLTLIGIVLPATGNAQEWMKSFEVAKKLAITQNKMLFVMWEQAVEYELPAFFKDDKGKTIYVNDLLLSEEANDIIWELFVPVLLNETQFEDLYANIKEDRSYGYLQLYRDDSIKIMDPNGNILNTAYVNYNYFDFRKFVNKYALNTKMLTQELRNYKNDKNFYSSFFLGSKYVDFAVYNSKDVIPELIELSNVYLDEAEKLMDKEPVDQKPMLEQRIELVRIKQDLVLNKPNRVIRRLKRMDFETAPPANQSLMSFLYFTAFKLQEDVENIQKWRPQLSLVELKEAQYIYKNLKN